MSSRVISGEGNGRLDFVGSATKSFAFLQRWGFALTRREATLARFESDRVFLNVYHGRSSYQLGLELGRLSGGDAYSLYELLRALAPADIERARCQTTDAEVLARCLASVAAIIEQHCEALLRGDGNAFAALSAAVAPHRKAITLDAQFGAIIDRADKAWESKDFSEAIALYEKSAPALDETRMRRLEYLRKHERK